MQSKEATQAQKHPKTYEEAFAELKGFIMASKKEEKAKAQEAKNSEEAPK